MVYPFLMVYLSLDIVSSSFLSPNSQIVDRVTAQYLFFLGCARLVYVENWIIEVRYDLVLNLYMVIN
jgi:hypothetical protein